MTTPVFQEAQIGEASNAATVVSASLTGVADHLYLAHIFTHRNSGAPAVSTVTGLGLTWALVKAQCSGNDEQRVEAWAALGAASSGAVTATVSPDHEEAAIMVTRWSGAVVADAIGASAGYNTNGVNGACSGGTPNDDATGSITTTAADSVVVNGIAYTIPGEPYAITSGWAMLANDTEVTAELAYSAEYKSVAVAGAVTLGAASNLGAAVQWALVAVEILGAPRVAPAATPRTLARFFDPHTGRPLRDIVAWQ